MIEKQLSILRSPDDGSPLLLRGGVLQSTGDSPYLYPIESGALVLLPVHGAGSGKPYIAHYQQDAVLFDYFEPPQDGATRHEHRRVHETILSHVPTRAATILDIGCGSAWVAEALCAEGKEVWSLDVSSVNPVKALKKHPFPSHYGIVADVMSLPFREKVFDVVIASEVLEHLVSPADFFQEVMRVVKPGGMLIITTPYKEIIQHSLCIHCNQPTPHHAHLHSFDAEKIRRISAGLRAVRAQIEPFSNKALVKLQMHFWMRLLPYPVWRMLDSLANALIGRQGRLLAVFRRDLHV
jgi:2-polyprenyl-3-methyl-5-hydroxy-6-metoxy-1,4-benzoquinol methylase